MRRVRPRFVANPAAASMNLLVGDALGDVPSTYQSATYSNKRFDVLAEARWHQVDMTVTGGFEITALRQISDGDEVVSVINWTSTKCPAGSQLAVLFRFTGDKINEERWFVDTQQWHACF